jgi:hypothetical protein
VRKLKDVRRRPALLALAVAVTVGSTVYATQASAAPAASAASRGTEQIPAGFTEHKTALCRR